VAGFQPIMPTFAGQISEESLIQLVAYIKSLQPEQNQSAGKAGTQTQNPNPGPSEKGR
jgi:cytochrome c oxidase subunit 2